MGSLTACLLVDEAFSYVGRFSSLNINYKPDWNFLAWGSGTVQNHRENTRASGGRFSVLQHYRSIF